MRPIILAAAVLVAVSIPLASRTTDTPLQSAALAWDRGDYVTALTNYLQILNSVGGDAAFEEIALQTGELFRTTELTADGDAPAFSPDGRLIAYETGALPKRTIRIVSADAPSKIVAELRGYRAVFSPDSTTLAYLSVTPTPELTQAAAAVEEGPAAQRTQRLNAFNARVAVEARIARRDVASGAETVFETGRLTKTGLLFSAQHLLVAGSTAGRGQVLAIGDAGTPVMLAGGEGETVLCEADTGGRAVAFGIRSGGARRGSGCDDAIERFGLITFPDRKVTVIRGSSPALSADGKSLAYVARDGAEYRLMLAPVSDPSRAVIARKGAERIDAPAFSPDGSRLAFQMMPKEDWEVYTVGRDGKGEARITREIQHDLLPRFIGPNRLIAMMGEARHRRSHLYDLSTGARTRIFHNNTVRTIAPEYAWVPSRDGRRLLIVAERDGNTVSVERGVYLVDLGTKITRDELRTRLRANLSAEQALRASTERAFAPIAADVRKVVNEASVARVFAHEKALFDFDSKHITQPGNQKAIQYLFDTYASFGYQPERQAFEARPRGSETSIPTANVLATLKGTVNPELVYIVSSHFDSVAAGPGADDDTSGTAALLEAARILAKHPQPATIVFASFTGEEAGLLGSREYVRQAVASKLKLVGALNNDMVGWANDHRLDNTIRYSNAGIRDIQHGAAMHFTNLITYDALYYKSTDAAAYYEAYGDIVGGIGSYPVLGNPHYHQPHDLLDTINHQLVTEVAKTTAATLMMLASSPSRITGLEVSRAGNGTAHVTWHPSPERGVAEYIVAAGSADNPTARQIRVKTPSATIPEVSARMVVSVKAVNNRKLEGWDWARTTVK